MSLQEISDPVLSESFDEAHEIHEAEKLFSHLAESRLNDDLSFFEECSSHFEDEFYFWEELLEYLLFRQRWSESFWLLETKISKDSEYTAQPNFTFRYALSLEGLGRTSEAVKYLKLTLDDWGGFNCAIEYEMAARISPDLCSIYKKMV